MGVFSPKCRGDDGVLRTLYRNRAEEILIETLGATANVNPCVMPTRRIPTHASDEQKPKANEIRVLKA